MATIIITGGTGLVGTALRQALLDKGYRVIILTRDKSAVTDPHSPLQFASWNVEQGTIDKTAIEKGDFIIHLAGENVAGKKWTSKQKEKIKASRVNSSRLLVDILQTTSNKIKAVVCASGIGWYGADPAIPNPDPFQETFPAAADFLGETCRLWEESIEPVNQLGKRLVKIRTGIVLSTEGGALAEFIKPLKWGVAAILGTGKQVISWIHLNDLVQVYISAIENENMTGVYNAVAPHPVSNKELTITLAGSRKKFYIPVHVPSFILKTVVGEMSIEVLKSTTVSCEKIELTGFKFRYPTIKNALAETQK